MTHTFDATADAAARMAGLREALAVAAADMRARGLLAPAAPQQPAPWPDAAEAYARQSTDTCDHGRLLWQSCRACGVGAYAPPSP